MGREELNDFGNIHALKRGHLVTFKKLTALGEVTHLRSNYLLLEKIFYLFNVFS